MTRARWALVAVGALAVLAVVALSVGDIWMAAYPHLPRRVQGLPYRLRAELGADAVTPVAIPTAVDTGAAPVAQPTLAPLIALKSTPNPEHTAIVVVELTEAPGAQGPIPTPEAVRFRAPPAANLEGLRHEYQTWNNCGPATVSMALSYFGASAGQAEAARHLKPDPDDKNVDPYELARYAREVGYEATVRVDGDEDTLRALVALGLPVIVETWFIPEPGDEMGHYRVLTGYSDAAGQFIAHDSYNGPGIELDYATFDERWRVFNRLYLVVYPPELAESVRAAIGEDVDDQAMHLGAASRAQDEVATRQDAFAWFNLGSSLEALGDAHGAADAFDQARALGLPWRMLWYQTAPFAAYASVGRWEDVKALAEANLRNASNLEETHYWLGEALAATGDVGGARAAWRHAIDLNPLYEAPVKALERLPD